MPTTRGWAFAGAGMALVVLWWMLGEVELLLAGTFLILATAVAIGYAQLHRPVLRTGRRIAASAVHSGDTVQVTLTLHNRSPRPLRNLTISDDVETLGTAGFEVSSIPAGESATATYRVLCRPRGVYKVGPSRAGIADPLGLAGLPAADGPVDHLVVYPEVEALDGFPVVRGQDPSMAASRPEHSHRGGEDFYTLREYQRGDDLRRVHWPSSAKTGQLMIRQLETPWLSRALVLLDVRSHVYESSDAFETAVSGAASVVTHLIKSGFETDLWAGEPQEIDAGNYAAAMERLALVEPNPAVDIEAVASHFRRKGGGGLLAIVTGTADRPLVSVRQLLSAEFSNAILMGVSNTTPQTLTGFHRLGVTTVNVAPGDTWAGQWVAAIGESWDSASAS